MRDPGGERFSSIEGARALMALWVVVSHLLIHSGTAKILPRYLAALPNGSLPVRVFMVMSGFVIAHLVMQKQEPYHAYVVRRFFRLAPLLWVVIGFILAYDALWPGVFRWNYALTERYLAGYVTMLHGVFPEEILADSARSIHPEAWSISLEWQFYLLAPLLLSRRTWPFIVAAALIAMLFGHANFLNWLGLTFDFAFLPMSMKYFLVGIGSYLVFLRLREIEIPFWGVIATAMATHAITNRDLALGVWSVVFCALLSRNGLRKFLETRVLVWLGSISYSLYLVHGLILIPVSRQLVDATWHIEFGTWTYFAIVTAIVTPSAILVAWLTHALIEQPGQRLGAFLGRRLIASSAMTPKREGAALDSTRPEKS